MVAFELPYHLPSAGNARDSHWRVRHRRIKSERGGACAAARAWGARDLKLPVVVTITRVAPRQLDSDNMSTAAKGLRDGIADALGVNDRDPRVEWRYQQEQGRPAAVRVEIAERSA